MNVLFFTLAPVDSKPGGGVTTVTRILSREFIKNGITVHYLSVLPCDDNTVPFLDIVNHELPFFKHICDKRNIKYLKQLLEKYNIDIVINQLGVIKPYLKLIKKAKSNSVKVLTVHHNCIKCMKENQKHIIIESTRIAKVIEKYKMHFMFSLLDIYHKIKYRNYFKYCLNNSSRLVLLSEHFKPEIKHYLKKYDEEKVASISNPFEKVENKEYESSKENRILFVGRIEKAQKRPDLAIEIWKKIENNFPTWSMDVVGDGKYLEEMKKSSKNYNLNRVKFYGFTEPKPFYERSKILIMTSAFEGFGMVLLEAMSYGVVPFAFDTYPALNDIIFNKFNGVIIPAFNTETYVNELGKLMNNEEKRKEMAINGKKSIEKFNPEKIAECWIELMNKVLK